MRVACLGAWLCLMPALSAQTGYQRGNGLRAGSSGGSTPFSPPDAGTAPAGRTVTGRVVNGLTGVPVAFALVHMSSRAVLTDAQGRFSFPDFTLANGYATVSKPGFSAGPTAESARQQLVPDLDAPIELKLYPDALLTGTVTGSDGLPLSRTRMVLSSLTYDTNGPRWGAVAFTQTDSHGEYRLTVPGGRYRLVSGYSLRSQERGELVLPVGFPQGTSSTAAYFVLASGEERQVNLRARTGPAFPVQITTDSEDNDRNLRLTVETPTGEVFSVGTQKGPDGYTAQLPAGTFTLHAASGERAEALEGEARVVVSSRGTSQVTIHLAPVPVFPVETISGYTSSGSTTPVATPYNVAFDGGAPGVVVVAGSDPPNAQQFNLVLHNLKNNGEQANQDARVSVQGDKTTAFKVQPGRYRLSAGMAGPWYIRSATCGVTDLMTQELVVAQGAAGSPIRLIVSNAVGQVRGSVTVGGQPATGWVYFIPRQPSLVPYFEVYVQTGGMYFWSGPPGNYLAVPSSAQVHENFQDEAFVRKFSTGAREIAVSAGATTTEDFEAAAAGVAR